MLYGVWNLKLPNQELNLGPLQWKQSPYRWTAREVAL